MSNTVISIENVSKQYRLGLISSGTVSHDLNRWWARVRGKPDPLTRIGAEDPGNRQGEYIWALREVSFQVQQGEILGIIGRNGAGKSTLLKILSRVTAPTTGQIKVKGRVASLLEVGTGFHPELTGRENIYLNGAILGMTRAEIKRKFDEIVAFAEVEKFIDTPVKRYSSGMHVRLAFAVAAHLEPEILLLDEVLAVGDVGFQEKCLGKMGDVARQGRTVLFVSHNLNAIWSLCPAAIWLDVGGVVACGPAMDVITEYRNAVRGNAEASLSGISRAGSGRVRITDIQLQDAEGQPCHSIASGHGARIVLRYSSEDNTGQDSLQIHVAVSSERQVRLFTLANVFSGDGFRGLTPNGSLACSIPAVPLVPGEYELTIACKLGIELADKFVSPVRLSVHEGDFFGSKRVPDPSFGNVLVEHSWKATAS